MVRKEEQQHSRPHPFVENISPQMIPHQDKQRQRHQKINRDLNGGFQLHSSTALRIQEIAFRLRG